jgi:solute carrier family 25 protein 33/36
MAPSPSPARSPPPPPPPPLPPPPAAGAAPQPLATLSVPSSRHFWAGAVGGAVAATLLSPLDIVRTRLQSARGHATQLKPRALLLAIVRKEGFFALWRGLVPTVFGVGPARSLYFGSYALAKEHLGEGAGGWGLRGAPLHLTGSALAGVFSNTLMSPWWVIRLRLQLQQTPIVPFWRGAAGAAPALAAAPGVTAPAYAGVWDAAHRIYREEGWRAFYRGLSASYLGVIETVLQFTIYGELKRAMLERDAAAAAGAAPAASSLPAVFAHSWAFGLSAASKLLASALTYPHEVLRTRMREEVAAVGAPLKYRTLLQSTRLILREEGVAGLYGGMGVHLLRTVPNAAILVWVVETMVGGSL